MRLNITYQRLEDLQADHTEQFAKGGVLVRGEPPPGLTLFADIELELTFAFAELAPAVLRGQVVQIVPGVGVAVAFDAKGNAELTAALAPRQAPPRPAGAALADGIQKALHGNREERGAILRGVNKLLHPYVLKNPNLGLDEVGAIAKMSTVNPELLTQIAARKEWAQRADIAVALVRNPKTLLAVAVKLLDYVAPAELRQLAKDGKTRPQIQSAARKKVVG